MANNMLPLIGVEAVVLNSNEYFKTLGEMDKKTQATAVSMGKATKNVGLGGKVIKDLTNNLNGLIQGLLGAVGVGGQFASTIATWVSGLVATVAPIAAVVAGVVALAAVIISLGQRSSEIEGIRNSFYSLNAQFGMMADDTLVRLRSGANGTINDLALMRTANLALAGSTDLIGQAYLQNFDRILTIAQVQARATGQSTEYLFDSLIRGLKRGSPLIIDNTGLIVNETLAQQEYAATLGVTAESLSEEQKQLALLYHTLAAGDKAIEAAGGVQVTTAIKIQQMVTTLQNTFDRAAMAIKPLFDLIIDGLQAVLNIVTPIINFIIDIVGFMLKHLSNGIRNLVSFLGTVFGPVWTFISQTFQVITANMDTFVYGAGKTMAAYANGILFGLVNYIMPAILLVSNAIASFLIGQSPPPEGPLSEIFNGGAAVMDAWVEGFVGASLDPVAKVSQDVANLMGGIANYSLKQVNQQLRQISKFLKPYENQVEQLEARFKSLDDVVQGLFKNIDAQQERLLERLNAGDTSAADQIRDLDVQRDQYQDILDTQSAVVDRAKYQLSLAKATVAAQKSALEIRKAQFKVEDAAKKAKTPKEKAAEEGKKPPKAPTEKPTPVQGDFGGLAIPMPGVEQPTWLDDLAGQFGAGFADGLDEGLMAELQGQSDTLGTIFGDVTPAAIGDRFMGFIDPIISVFEDNLLTPFRAIIDNITFLFTGEGEFDGYALTQGIEDFIVGIPNLFADLGGLLYTHMLSPMIAIVGDAISAIVNPTNALSLAFALQNFFAGSASSAGSLAWLLVQGVNSFVSFAAAAAIALTPFGDLFYYALVLPVIDGLNWIVDQFNFFANQVNISIAPMRSYLESLTGISLAGLAVPTIHRVPTPPPPSSNRGVIGATRARPQWMGGLTEGPGAVRTDERGQEGFVLGPATQMMTFPNTFLNILTDIRDVLVTSVSAPMPTFAGDSGQSTTNTTYNFNGMKSVDEGRRSATMLRLFKK